MTQTRPLHAGSLPRALQAARRSPSTLALAAGASCLAAAVAFAVEPDLGAGITLTAVACCVAASATRQTQRASRPARLRVAGGILAAAFVVLVVPMAVARATGSLLGAALLFTGLLALLRAGSRPALSGVLRGMLQGMAYLFAGGLLVMSPVLDVAVDDVIMSAGAALLGAFLIADGLLLRRLPRGRAHAA